MINTLFLKGKFFHQLKRILQVKSIAKDRTVTRKQMLHSCINLRTTKAIALNGLTIIVGNSIKLMDDGTFVIPWNFMPKIKWGKECWD